MAVRQNTSNELILNVWQQARLTWSFVIFMAVSGILSAVALLTNSIPILIGAMIIAPAFPPLALLTLAFCGGQYRIALRGLGTITLGLVVAIGFSMLMTWLLNFVGIISADENLLNRPLLEERVRPGWYSIVAAFGAGVAGMIGVVKNKMDTLIGTVASLALVPAGGAAGIALVSGDPIRGLGGIVLLGINVLMIVAMGILVVVVARPGAMDSSFMPEESIHSDREERRAS